MIPELARVLIIGVFIATGYFKDAAYGTAGIRIDGLDCSGFEVRLEGGNSAAEYWATLIGTTNSYGWYIEAPFRIYPGTPIVYRWDEEWQYCWRDWVHCVVYGPCPNGALPTDNIKWSLGLWVNGERIDLVETDLPLPCGYRIYLPMVYK